MGYPCRVERLMESPADGASCGVARALSVGRERPDQGMGLLGFLGIDGALEKITLTVLGMDATSGRSLFSVDSYSYSLCFR